MYVCETGLRVHLFHKKQRMKYLLVVVGIFCDA